MWVGGASHVGRGMHWEQGTSSRGLCTTENVGRLLCPWRIAAEPVVTSLLNSDVPCRVQGERAEVVGCGGGFD